MPGMRNKKLFMKDFFVFIIFFLFWFGLFYFTGHLDSDYHLIDDHQVITLNERLETYSLPHVIKEYSELDGKSRFRFLFPVQRVVMTKILGTNFKLWSLYIALLGVFTSFFLYKFCRITGFTAVQSFIFSLLTLTGVQAAAWYQPADAENLGMFFLSLTLLFAAKSIFTDKRNSLYKLCLAASMILMSLSKESFILMIPAVLFLYIWLYDKKYNLGLIEAVKVNKYLVSIPVFIMSGLLIYIIFFVGIDPTGQTGIDSRIFSLLFIREFIFTMRHYTIFLIILFGMLILLDHDAKDTKNFKTIFPGKLLKDFLNVTILFLLIIIPQYILYYKSGMRDRYFLPFVVGFSFFTIYLLKLIFDSQNITRFVKYLHFSMILFLLIFEIRFNTIDYIVKFAADSKSSVKMLDSIISNTGKDASILAVIDPVSGYEQGRSFMIYLNNIAEMDKVYFDLVRKDYVTDSFSDSSFTRISENATFAYLSSHLIDSIKNKSSIECIAVFPKLEKNFIEKNKEWFDEGNFRREEFDFYTVYFKK